MNEHRDVCEYHAENAKLTREIHSAIVGDMSGSTEGLVPRVARHDRQLAGLNRFVWLVVGALVVAVAAIIQADVLK
jgi:hypothetical protein